MKVVVVIILDNCENIRQEQIVNYFLKPFSSLKKELNPH